jgi:RHS repeat-associated protein
MVEWRVLAMARRKVRAGVGKAFLAWMAVQAALGFALMLGIPSAWAHDVLGANGQTLAPPEDQSGGLGSPQCPAEGGDPIYLDTGEFAVRPGDLTTPDLVIPVRGHTIDLRRSYRSGYAYPGVLGYGWDFAMNRRLRRLDNGNILITTGTCRSDEYTFNGMGWSAPSGVFRTLVLNTDGSYTETTPSGSKDTFDDHGNLIERRDRHGNRIAFEYSEEAMPIVGRLQFFVDSTPRVIALEYRLLRIIDPTDREIELSYNAQGRIQSITDWIDRTWTYGYDSFGNLTSVTSPPIADYPSGTTTTYAYQDSRFPHKITRVTPPNGQATGTFRIQNLYDPQGRVQTQEDGAGGTVTFTYEPTRTLVVDANGTTWISTTQNRQITSETVVTRGVRPSSVESAGTQYTTSFQYANNLRSRTVYPEGNAVEFVYDSANSNVLARGNLLEVRRLPKPGSSALPLVTKYTYKTPFQQIGTIEDPRGKLTEYFYDGNHDLERIQYPTVPEGFPAELFTTNGFGQRTTATDANGNVAKLEYDANGYLDKVTRAFGTALAAVTELDPDAVGRPMVVRDANNHTTQLTYNAWDRLQLRVAPAPFLYETEYHFDPSGNLARIEQQSNLSGDPQTNTFTYNVLDWRLTAKNELNETTTFAYDANGNVATTTAPDLNTTTRIFDERNMLYQETGANGDQVRLHYHPNGRLSKVIDGNGNATRYDYDAFDRQNLITHADNSTEGRIYDSASRTTSSTTRAGAMFTYGYDDLNRLRSRTTPEELATFTYDLGGRMTTAANPAASLVFAYNARSQLTSEVTTISGLSARTVLHAYDGMGNRTQMTHPDAGYVTYGYDEVDRLELLQDGGTATLSQWTWDELSRPATRVLPSGVASTWTYDEASRVATITHADSGGPIDTRTYGRDPTGTITSLTDGLGANLYGYDASKQLTSVDYGAASLFPDTTWTYDDAGSRLAETAGSGTTYVANALNQYASVGGVTQLYDTNGNLIDDGTNTYTFDSQSRLVSALADDGAGGTIAASYGYDPFMRRVRKTVAGTTTYFLWSGSELIEEYDGAGDRRVQYIYGAEYSPVHVRADDASGIETVFDVHTDHLSTPRVVTDPSEGAVWRAEYASFGEASVDPSSSLEFGMRFPGQYFDRETGLHYNRYRYYEPRLGRYMSADPIGQLSGINLYLYAASNPIAAFDPFGLEFEIEVTDSGGGNGSTYGGTATVTTDHGTSVSVRASSHPNPNRDHPTVTEGSHGATYSGTGHRQERPGVRLRDGAPVATTGPNPRQNNQAVADGINVHCGASPTNRGSAGCITIHPDDCERFFEALNEGETGTVNISRRPTESSGGGTTPSAPPAAGAGAGVAPTPTPRPPTAPAPPVPGR